MLAQAYRMKEMYPESIEAARRAIDLDPTVGEPHFFLADSLRMSGKAAESKPEYEQYLKLSDFESSTTGKVFNYWLRGFLIGQGKKTRATQKDIWNDLRSLAYFGMGDAERLLSNPDAAIGHHRKSLELDAQDPKVHYALALAFTHKTELTGDTAHLPEALTHFRKVIELNEYLAEAEQARKYIAKIDTLLQAQR
jgi:tetratricopeptide (TPR) repeat protein